MRIRKRFPASSALITDPQLNRSRVVQQTTSLQLHPTHHHHHVQQAIHDDDCQPFDPSHDHCPTVVGTKSSKTSLISDNQLINIKPKEGGKGRYTCDDDDDKQDQEDDGSTNYISPRKQYTVLGVATTHTGVVPTSSSSRHANATSLHTVVDGRWYDGDEVIPLKKRRGSFLGLVEKMQPKMMSKTNKKCTTISMNDDQGSYHVKESVDMSSRGSTKKMNKKGSGIMEGSRCSRVNGRGWRCCQQTLVGYSLCEHHLGKGRLRSIASVKNRAMGKSINTNTITTTATNTSTIAPQPKFERLSSLSNSSSSSVLVQASQDKEMLLNDSSEDDDDNDNDGDYEDGEKKKKKKKNNNNNINMPVVVRKTRMKLGMVKARSLSSLLSQTSNTAVSVASEFNNSN